MNDEQEYAEIDRMIERLLRRGISPKDLLVLVEEWLVNRFRGHPRADELVPALRHGAREALRRMGHLDP